jgi:hypothetical protein
MASKPTNLQAAIDMLQKPADVGSISPIGINDKFTPELSRDPVLRKLQQFFRIAKNEVNNPLNYLAGAGAIGIIKDHLYLEQALEQLLAMMWLDKYLKPMKRWKPLKFLTKEKIDWNI